MNKREEIVEKKDYYYMKIGGKVRKVKPMGDGSWLVYLK